MISLLSGVSNTWGMGKTQNTERGNYIVKNKYTKDMNNLIRLNLNLKFLF